MRIGDERVTVGARLVEVLGDLHELRDRRLQPLPKASRLNNGPKGLRSRLLRERSDRTSRCLARRRWHGWASVAAVRSARAKPSWCAGKCATSARSR